MQTRSEAEVAEQLARRLREMSTAMEQAQQGPTLPNEVTRGGPIAVYQGYAKLRDELRSQLKALEEQRDEISNQLQDPMVSGANRAGLSKRIEHLDGRIAMLDQQIAEVDAAVARAGTLPGIRPIDPREGARRGPEEGIALGGLFILAVLLPLSIAYARRIWRRGAAVVASIPSEITERLSRMDQHLDAIALEVERIGEGQRYLTRVYAEQQHSLGQGVAEPVETPEQQKDWQRKSL